MMLMTVYIVASTPKLDMQEKGKVSEKEFAEVCTYTNIHMQYYVFHTFYRVTSDLARYS